MIALLCSLASLRSNQSYHVALFVRTEISITALFVWCARALLLARASARASALIEAMPGVGRPKFLLARSRMGTHQIL
jgi:hypothetical protein